jgi:transforming growth factor-beta-induced protein
MPTAAVLRRPTALLVLAASTLALSACSDDDDATGPAPQTITQTAAATASVSTLVSALQAAGLDQTLNGAGPFTVFAPVNSAFAALPADVVTRLLETGNRAILTKLLTFHVVPGRLTASQLTNGQVLTTVEGTPLTVTITGNAVRINGALVTTADVQASNGVVHLIDGVMLGSLDIVDQAIIRGFSSLVSAVQTAGLVDALRGGGAAGLTVFAPTNAAFAAIPGGAPGSATVLSQVLRLHVVGTKALSTGLTNGQDVTSLLGPSLRVGITGATIRITGPANSATVSVADVTAKNGVIHVIDSVLLP